MLELSEDDFKVNNSKEQTLELYDKVIYFKPYYVCDKKRYRMKAQQMIVIFFWMHEQGK